MYPSVSIELPLPTYQHLQSAAQRRRQAIPDLVERLLTLDTLLPPLPITLAEELAAFAQLSTEVLWLLARTTLTEQQRIELATLNRKAQQADGLTVIEQQRQMELLALYQDSMVRRTKALDLLRERGQDITPSSLLHPHE
ncbi:MAG: hypothetical protein ACOYNY_46085 [Caldilineaceae bacterium]